MFQDELQTKSKNKEISFSLCTLNLSPGQSLCMYLGSGKVITDSSKQPTQLH